MIKRTCIVCSEPALPRLRWCAECVPESVKRKAETNARHRAKKAAGLVVAPVLRAPKPGPAVLARKPEKQAQATAVRSDPGPAAPTPDFRAIVVQVQALCADALACPLSGVVSTVAPIPVPPTKEPLPVIVPARVLPELVRQALAMPTTREEPPAVLPERSDVSCSTCPRLAPSLVHAIPLTVPQVLAARAVAPTAQGRPLPQCPTCLRFRVGRDGTKGEGRVLCLKDELAMTSAFGDEALPDAQGRGAILEDRRGDVSVFWLRADIANLSSARGCRYYLPHPCLSGEADGSALHNGREWAVEGDGA